MMADCGMDVDGLPCTAPPGEEGMHMSHAGGEYKAFEGLAEQIAHVSGYHYIDLRTQQDRTENQTKHWHLQLNLLVNAYLNYRSRDSGDNMPTLDDELLEPPLDDSPSVSLTNIELVNVFKQSYSSLQSRSLHKYPNKTLIYHSYIRCAPIYPTVAVLLRTLATYRQIHRSCPRFSIQAQVKSLCFLHDVHPHNSFQLS
ncbi:uncharacterized protein F5891DRAFT_960225 [Suillus fuscotomentosus]|uniref:Uncharacterized protein n=1 Tax=Suillus fuscotomentosus TaxID=1912939 RepID=A0AAD4HG70_9AGAM|nr:uncharacterized protein F5891DRAFT_960225 [Suillus fuscotomentosus]KAG1895393.1 hypothetical protein F5891DRAFT_960225 [Suillus fuscotomentosus]